MLVLSGFPRADASFDDLLVPSGSVLAARVADPDLLLAQLAGEQPGGPGILLDGRALHTVPPEQRWRAGLGVATCRVPPVPGLRLLDIVAIGDRPAGAARLPSIALGLRSARETEAATQARVRALAGQIGLSAWLGLSPGDVPQGAAALADVARALLGTPSALVVRDPDWLPRTARARVGRALLTEGRRHGMAILTVGRVRQSSTRLPPP